MAAAATGGAWFGGWPRGTVNWCANRARWIAKSGDDPERCYTPKNRTVLAKARARRSADDWVRRKSFLLKATVNAVCIRPDGSMAMQLIGGGIARFDACMFKTLCPFVWKSMDFDVAGKTMTYAATRMVCDETNEVVLVLMQELIMDAPGIGRSEYFAEHIRGHDLRPAYPTFMIECGYGVIRDDSVTPYARV